jgi:hypothetical protein
MEWVAVRIGETTGATTAETVETIGGAVGSKVIPTCARHTDAAQGQGSGDLLVVFGVTGDLARVMTCWSL